MMTAGMLRDVAGVLGALADALETGLDLEPVLARADDLDQDADDLGDEPALIVAEVLEHGLEHGVARTRDAVGIVNLVLGVLERLEQQMAEHVLEDLGADDALVRITAGVAELRRHGVAVNAVELLAASWQCDAAEASETIADLRGEP